MMTVKFDDVAEIYDKTRGIPSAGVINALVKDLVDYKCVLDVGVGTGRFAKPLLGHGFEVTGIDVSKGMVKLAKGKGVKELVIGDVCRMPFKNKRFDCALLVHMLHLIANWFDLLSEVTRVTRSKFISIAGQFKPKDLSMRHLYMKQVRFYGSETRSRIEGEEMELAIYIKPEKCQKVLSYQEIKLVDEVIDALSQRKVTMTWNVPEKIHNRVIRELKDEYEGMKVNYQYETFLLVWDINDFNEAALTKVAKRRL